ncbi:MAG: hypothetical protein JO148_04195 [Acidimicrobiia bacterium]|nr:hypothetical protein [Acidimicrobiia bacterium]
MVECTVVLVVDDVLVEDVEVEVLVDVEVEVEEDVVVWAPALLHGNSKKLAPSATNTASTGSPVRLLPRRFTLPPRARRSPLCAPGP